MLDTIPKTQHFRLVRCLKEYPCTMGKSSFEDLFAKVIKEFRPKILWGFELTKLTIVSCGKLLLPPEMSKDGPGIWTSWQH